MQECAGKWLLGQIPRDWRAQIGRIHWRGSFLQHVDLRSRLAESFTQLQVNIHDSKHHRPPRAAANLEMSGLRMRQSVTTQLNEF